MKKSLFYLLTASMFLSQKACSKSDDTQHSSKSTAVVAKNNNHQPFMPSPGWKKPKDLPADYLKKCEPGYYKPDDQNKYRIMLIKKRHGACMIYKYYKDTVLRQEDSIRFTKQKGPLGDICIRQVTGKYGCQEGVITTSTITFL